eukprot:scaffold133488_cov39-Cyclotella_meneghiniana.AAC.3
MDDILRQSGVTFKKLLSNMRRRMDDDDIKLIFARVLDKLPDEEKQAFQDDGLHHVPTWKQANGINL